MNRFGFVRVSVCSPRVAVGNPRKNIDAILAVLPQVGDSDVVVFPELHTSGYTCRDLFRSHALISGVEQELVRLAQATAQSRQLLIVGAPVAVGNELFNCAVLLNQGRLVGIVPKQSIPNYAEFEESRWFRAGDGVEPKAVTFGDQTVPFGTDLLFHAAAPGAETIVGVEICEDLWMPIPPSSYQALAGANLLVNLSASNETVGKCEYRRALVTNQSGRCVAAYAYASSGPWESTTDLVFGGHCMIAENSSMLAESSRVGDESDPVSLSEKLITADVDTQKLQGERRMLTSFGEAGRQMTRTFRTIEFAATERSEGLRRAVNGQPFVPQDAATLHHRCAEIFGIQCAGLHRRLEAVAWPDVNIGVSGGLDSTLALIVAVRTLKAKGLPLTKIHGLTMPGFGTTSKTKANALRLMETLGVSAETIDIRPLCVQAFRSTGHQPFGLKLDALGERIEAGDVDKLQAALQQIGTERHAAGDLVFENVQARVRTLLLMSRGFVIGTGDMSELALGWCTYNADHMSMYNPNAGIPKTLVKFLVKWVAENEFGRSAGKLAAAQSILLDIVSTTVSPELLPMGPDGEIVQSTEEVVGPYELHDFYLRHFVRDGFSPEKILFLAEHATFSRPYPTEERVRTLATFLRRFFAQQYKRSCVPDGPKVGTVSLSPRGDWRMPSDADVELWLKSIESPG